MRVRGCDAIGRRVCIRVDLELKEAGLGKERFIKELPFLGVLLKKEQDVEAYRTQKKTSWKA